MHDIAYIRARNAVAMAEAIAAREASDTALQRRAAEVRLHTAINNAVAILGAADTAYILAARVVVLEAEHSK
jgi:hypothetical protein